MKRNNKKGFTIVELVIVIAVIVILAAVLIPTFASIIKKANESVDMQVVKQMNDALVADEIVNGTPATVVVAKEILVSNGCDDFTPADSQNVFYWVGSENRVILWTWEDAEEPTAGEVVFPKELAKKYKDVTEPSADWANLADDHTIQSVTSSDLLDKIAAAANGSVLQLPKNTTLEISLSELGDALIMAGDVGKSLTIDLNGSTINSTDGYSLDIPPSGELILVNGAVGNMNMPSASKAAVTVDAGAKLVLRNVDVNTNGTAIFPEGNASEVVLDECNIHGAGFGVATNNLTSDNIHISITNTEIGAYNNADGFTGVMINVPGLLEIDNCKIVGDYQGIIVRSGTAVIKNSDVSVTEESWIPYGITNYFGGINWGEGNTVNLAAITIGNKHPTSYQTPVNVTLTNTTFNGIHEWHAMYVYANSGDGLGVTLTFDNDCVFNGEVEYGNSGANITVNGAAAPAN